MRYVVSSTGIGAISLALLMQAGCQNGGGSTSVAVADQTPQPIGKTATAEPPSERPAVVVNPDQTTKMNIRDDRRAAVDSGQGFTPDGGSESCGCEKLTG